MSPGWFGIVCIALGVEIEPDLVAARSLPVERKPASIELPRDLPVSKAREPPYSSRNYDGVVLLLTRGLKVWNAATLTTCTEQLFSNVARNFECLSNSAALRDEA